MLEFLPPEGRANLGLQSIPIPANGPAPHERFGISPDGFNAALNAAAMKYDAERQREAYCIESLDLWPHVEKALAGITKGEKDAP